MRYDLAKHNFNDPNPWVALDLDRSTFFESQAKSALLRGNASRARQFLLPIIRPMARLSIILVQLLRIVIPNSLTSSRLLHATIVWGMRNFLSPAANYLIFRHFHIGSQMLRFFADNVPNTNIQLHPLKPRAINDFLNNMYMQHDLNIYNFIIQVNAQDGQFVPTPLERINFSAIEDFDDQLPVMPNRWHNFLDLQSAIEFYTPLYGLFLSDADFWRASNSLQLDETIAIYVARLFNREGIVALVNNKHPCVPISTLEAGYRLMLHGLDAENLYGFIKHMRDQQLNQKKGVMKRELKNIPVIEAPEGPLQLASHNPAMMQQVLKRTNEILPSPLLRLGDKYALEYLQNSNNPYLSEINQIAQLLGRPGGYALNFSFEMGCTTGCRSPDGKTAMQIYRTLDWPFRLGADVVVAKHKTSVGDYYNITWPGYVGVLTAMAPARFAAAINQPPMAYTFDSFGLSLPVDWIVNRWRIRKMTALPPTHLLRQVFEQRRSYEEAKTMLATTPICIPVIYTLTGTKPGEGCIIERRENNAVIHEGPVCITNHWLNSQFKGRPRRRRNSRRRLAAMQKSLPVLKGDFDWLTPPVLDGCTRMAAELNAESGSLLLQGWHGDEPQTNILRIGP